MTGDKRTEAQLQREKEAFSRAKRKKFCFSTSALLRNEKK